MAADGGQGVTVSKLKYTCAAGHEYSSKILTSFHQQFDIQQLSLFWTLPLVIFVAISYWHNSKILQCKWGTQSRTNSERNFIYRANCWDCNGFYIGTPLLHQYVTSCGLQKLVRYNLIKKKFVIWYCTDEEETASCLLRLVPFGPCKHIWIPISFTISQTFSSPSIILVSLLTIYGQKDFNDVTSTNLIIPEYSPDSFLLF